MAATRASSVRAAVLLTAALSYGAFTLWGMAQPTHGANIGAGVVFLSACAVVPVLLGVAAWTLLHGDADGRRSRRA